ncbi:MAG: carbonic anhydrase [Rhizobiales bacterium 24-66-13]|jgi:carbonic anhydrase|nr:MAG: carbonic anhydrase [Azorhizobium sp. 12-66-6]OYY85590.1 MAG: carbonic anhydrase [Rhizobiales bacterium 35-66-30]OYZ80192.1 MAG: carbonic anhydrase [Rhizobiales bacterium 24-66-13]OZB07020.1 MAG: carbonic anhydrase [Rhizobiales bacterium 39-66-18]HQS09176.1 carbonic anhydrase [Xanthobacteraceae bacterium]
MCQNCIDARLNPSRRHLLSGGLALAGLAATAPLFGTAFAQAAAPDPTAPAPNSISPDEALGRIMKGNARYAANTRINKDYSAGRVERARAQYPIAAILSCADSRVAPELTFDQGPGRLFVVRVAGNFVNDDGLASLEYGVKVLGVPLIMVLGHSGCGAVSATIKVIQEGVTLPGHLPELVGAMKPGIEAAIARKPKDLLAEATAENVRYNTRRLAEAKPIIGEMVGAGKVKVVGAVYDISTGKVKLL